MLCHNYIFYKNLLWNGGKDAKRSFYVLRVGMLRGTGIGDVVLKDIS